jgi:hypothetical protein
MNPTGAAGGLHHQTSGLPSREAFRAAGDPSRYPEQIREGLVPWQPRKYYYPSGGPGGGGRGQSPGKQRAPARLRVGRRHGDRAVQPRQHVDAVRAVSRTLQQHPVTDENGQVQILAADDPIFHYLNEIDEAAWGGWVQERGTYFIVPDDERYVDLIQIHEPFEHNAGWKRGALVSANVGKGRWIFVGLGPWRQVAAGTDGAFQLLANLASRGKRFM